MIRFHGRMGEQGDHFNRMANIFNQEHHPDIFVKTELFAGTEYFTKINALIAGGTLGDGFWISSIEGFYRYVAAGAYLALDDIAAQLNYDLGQFVPSVIEANRVDGKLMGLPWAVHAGWIGVYYNKAMFDKGGVEYPTNDWTYDDLLQTAQRLSDPDNGVFGWSTRLQWFYYNTIMRAFGGEPLNAEGTKCLLDSSEARAAMQYLYDAVVKYRIATKPPDIVGSASAMFANNQCAMFTDGFWGKAVEAMMTVKNGWGVALGPKGPGNENGATLYFDPLGINAKSSHPVEAFQFLAQCCSKEGGTDLWKVANSVPGARTDVLNDPEALADPHFAVYGMGLETATPPILPANNRELEYTRSVTDGFTLVWTEEMELDQAIKETLASTQAVLDKPAATIEE
jgi:multiple sugar transport system substrate-binding protein